MQNNNAAAGPFLLPVTYPLFDYYPAPSTATAILGTKPELHPWLLSQFVQLMSMNCNSILDTFDFCPENCPFLKFHEIRWELVSKRWNRLSNFLVDAISSGYYVRAFVNPLKLSLYEGVAYPHDILVYGYDLQENLFYVGDHFKSGKFSFETCTFEELEYAYDHESNREIEAYVIERIQLIELDTTLNRIKFILYEDKGHAFDFQTEKVKRLLTDYMEGRPSYMDKGYSFHPGLTEKEAVHHYWGINCYDAMVESLPLLYSSEYPFTRQSLYILQLHKKIMVERLKYMSEHDILQNNEKFIGVYQQVSTMIGKLVLKYMHAEMADDFRKTELIPQMEKLLWETKELEAQVLPELIANIRI